MTTPTERPAAALAERDTLIDPLLKGMIPTTGFDLFMVGRTEERRALALDRARAAGGRAAVRIVIGRPGCGKSLLLASNAADAMAEAFVTTQADLTLGRRLHSTQGHAISLYRELTRNLTTRSSPNGNALRALLDRFVLRARDQAEQTSGSVDAIITAALTELCDTTAGYDFRQVVRAYWRGYETGEDDVMDAAVRWLRGEYTSRQDARMALGVRTVIDDRGVWDALKALSTLARLAGYRGLLVSLDELGSVLSYGHPSRGNNIAEILRLLNDCTSGTASAIALVLAGIPEVVTDERQGLHSDAALRSRLSANPYAAPGLKDTTNPVLDLRMLDFDEQLTLLENLNDIFAGHDPDHRLLSSAEIRWYAEQRHTLRLGGSGLDTPRDHVRAFLQVLSLLEQNPDLALSELLAQHKAPATASMARPGASVPAASGDELDDDFEL